MTPEAQTALDRAVHAAGSQIELCRRVGKPQSSFWTWQRGAGPTPAVVPELVAMTDGRVTADQFRRDAFGWLAPINDYLAADLTADARLAGIDLIWHQVAERDAEKHLETRGWTRRRSRKALRELASHKGAAAA